MLLNCYYYAPHNHSLLVRHLVADLKHMRELGADIVSVCVQEDQLWNWHQKRLHNFVDLAHEAGLKVHAVPNRWCGLVAGWLDGHSDWTLAHPETFLRGADETAVSDPQHPAVRAHYERHVELLLRNFSFDGIIWDEPRSSKPALTLFLDEMSAYAKSIKPDVVISLFAEAGRLDTVNHLALTKHMDFLGADGHVRRNRHQMHRMKNTIFTTHETFEPILRQAGKKTMFLLEAQRHRDEDLEEYLAVMDQAFSLPMDQLMFYYSAHEMSPQHEERFNEATWAAVRRLKQAKT
jgi:hypothetical protein